MIRRGLAALIAGLVLGSCEPAFATTWTVTNDATLSAANAGAVAGDVVRLAAFNYGIGIAPVHAGTPGSRIYYYGQQSDSTLASVASIDFRTSSAIGAGSYVTVKWVTSRGDMGFGNNLSAGNYPYVGPTQDSIISCYGSNSAVDFYGKNNVIMNCRIAGVDKNIRKTAGQLSAHSSCGADWCCIDSSNTQPGLYNKMIGCDVTYTCETVSKWQFIVLRGCYTPTFYGNTFNFTDNGSGEYSFGLEAYYVVGMDFRNNVLNYHDNSGHSTTAIVGYRDYSQGLRFVGNTIHSDGATQISLGLNQGGSCPEQDGYAYTGHNYWGYNNIYTENPKGNCGGLCYASAKATGDTVEFNIVRTKGSSATAMSALVSDYSTAVVRHNTFWTEGSVAIDLSASARTYTNIRLASNVFYARGATASPMVKFKTGAALDSAGVFFGPSGSASAAISYNGSNGAPGSGGNYGLSGKSVWGSPRFVDTTSTAALDAHLGSGSYADNASGPTHIDGYAGAYAPGAATYWTITASAGSNGSISPSGAVSVVQGASQTFTITPNTNYAVDSLKVDGAYVGALTTYTFTNVQAAHTIAATFKASVTNYTITASAINGVSISPNGPVTVASGGSQAFTITPTTGYHIVGISVDGSGVGTSSPYTFTNVTANHTIAATGGINTYTITASAGSNGSISPTGTTTLNYGDSQTYTMTPNSGYHVSAVTVDGSGAGTGNTYPFTNVTANHTISVAFAADATTYDVVASANDGGSVTPGGTTTWAAGTSPVYTIVTLDGYQCDDVLVDGVSVGTPATYTFTSIAAPHTISATFSVALTSYTINASAANGASITPSGASLAGSGTNKTYLIQTPQGTSPAVYVDGVYAGQLTSYTFSSVSANHTIFATAVSVGGSAPSDGCACYRIQ